MAYNRNAITMNNMETTMMVFLGFFFLSSPFFPFIFLSSPFISLSFPNR